MEIIVRLKINDPDDSLAREAGAAPVSESTKFASGKLLTHRVHQKQFQRLSMVQWPSDVTGLRP